MACWTGAPHLPEEPHGAGDGHLRGVRVTPRAVVLRILSLGLRLEPVFLLLFLEPLLQLHARAVPSTHEPEADGKPAPPAEGLDRAEG